jgi:hypothetical protein
MKKKKSTILIYKGVVKGNVVELEEGVQLPEGMTVEVIVKEQDTEPLASSGYPKGSPQAILAAPETPPHCTEEDVDALMKAIKAGKQPVRFEGVFDRKEKYDGGITTTL